jgi:hypothetical protein
MGLANMFLFLFLRLTTEEPTPIKMPHALHLRQEFLDLCHHDIIIAVLHRTNLNKDLEDRK